MSHQSFGGVLLICGKRPELTYSTLPGSSCHQWQKPLELRLREPGTVRRRITWMPRIGTGGLRACEAESVKVPEASRLVYKQYL